MTIWMMDTMVSMTLLMALVLMIRKPVSHYFGAHIAYLLWALPLARLFMPTLTLKVAAPVESAAATPLLSDIAASASGKASAVGAAVSELASIDWMLVALVIWIGGAGMLFISKLAAYFQFREDIVSDGHLVGQHGRIKILETAAVGGPLAFGLFEKYIAVPTNFFRDYAPRERELALEHEIAHHESGDLAANFVGLLVLSLHWFNPVAWYAWIAFRQDQETACDARVLQNGGRDLRAVYGRTIAKSVSGHRLGLASPLNQKNKIKDRLKMLGQSEKSSLRKRMGALMVGASTVVALPLTATVTYAVEAEAQPQEFAEYQDTGVTRIVVADKNADSGLHLQLKDKPDAIETAENVQELANLVPPAAPMPPEAPSAPSPPLPPAVTSGPIHITMQNGKAIVFKTNGQLSKEDIRRIAEEAGEVRRETKEGLRESMIARQEMRIALAEARRDIQEAQREAREAQRETMAAADEARREADRAQREAQREAPREAISATREARQAQSLASRMWEISQITIKPYFVPSDSSAHHSNRSSAACAAISREIALTRVGTVDGPVWINVGTHVKVNAAPYASDCPEVDRKAVLTAALKSLENKRAIAAEYSDKDARQRVMVEACDRDIETLKAHLSLT